MHNNLIIVPVGSPVDKFLNETGYPMKLEKHWRWIKNERNYKIIAVQYSDFVPEEGTYDELIVMKGFKWTIAKELQKRINFNEWEYVGFYDDDVILDNYSMNYSFDIAKERNFKAFQISLESGSESQWPSTRRMSGVKYTYTDFIEIMCPVFHKSVIDKFMKLANSYDVFCGWGLDYVLSEYLEIEPAVIHEVTMFHPPRPNTGSGYDKSKAFQEMHLLLNDIFPKVMQEQGRKVQRDYNNFRDSILSYVLL